MNSTENNELNYQESNWSFDPGVDLDYENKFFQIIFDPSKDPTEVDSLWREPLKEFIKTNDKGVVLRGFPNPLIIGFFVEDLTKDYLLSVVNELKRLKMPDNVSIKRYKNHEDFQQFDNFSQFEDAINNL